MKILIIEDDAVDERSIVQNLLAVIPKAEIVWRMTLMEGMREADKGIALIVLDLTLPDSPSSSATIAAFKPITQTIPTIIVSGTEDPVVMVEAIDSGALGFIFKSKLETMIGPIVIELMGVT